MSKIKLKLFVETYLSLEEFHTLLHYLYPFLIYARISISGHETGTTTSLVAVLLGAKIIERHFTLDKTMRGSDHQASLDPAELTDFVRKVRQIEKSSKIPLISSLEISKILNVDQEIVDLLIKQVEERQIFPCEIPCNQKLGKSLVYSRNLKCGDVLTGNNVAVKVSEPKGIPAENYDDLLGKILSKNVEADDACQDSDFL
jgi:sialic acid synthase